MPKITILSRSAFKKFIDSNGINDNTVDSITNLYLISINTTYGNDSEPFFKLPHNNVLTLFFDDCDEDCDFIDLSDQNKVIKVKAMSEQQALTVFNFTKTINNDSNVVVHCTLGQSRSGAIGAFINDYFGQRWEDLKRNNPQIKPNTHIASILRKFLF